MEKQHYNIMTSCDERLVSQLPVLLYSISRNLKNAETDFWFLHRNIPKECLKMMYDLCTKLGNVVFHDIKVPNPELYDELAKYGGGWAGEAYYSFCAHLLLPEEVDRVLYLDAGDVIVVDDISSYYNDDFEGKSLICTCIRYKEVNNQLVELTRDDLHEREGLFGILRGIFNSGSYVMNLEQLRKDGFTMNDYLYLVQSLRELIGKDKNDIYWGDQGLLGAAFVGDIKFYDYEKIRNVWYMPYNFCLWYYNGNNVKPFYKPAIVHYAGAIKPWWGDYLIFLERFQNKNQLSPISELKIGQAEWYYLWHEYAILVDRILKEIGY